MHKAILLDLGNVVIPFDFARGFRAMEGFCPHAPAEIRKRIDAGLVARYETGLIESGDFVRELCVALDLCVDYAHFCRIWSSIFGEPLIPESLLEGLAARYRLVMVSNTNAIHFEMIRERYPLLRHFHDRVLSFEVHSLKPQPEIFRAAIARARCRPEECFYADDIAANVEAAWREGMDAVVFESREQLERELIARGML